MKVLLRLASGRVIDVTGRYTYTGSGSVPRDDTPPELGFDAYRARIRRGLRSAQQTAWGGEAGRTSTTTYGRGGGGAGRG